MLEIEHPLMGSHDSFREVGTMLSVETRTELRVFWETALLIAAIICFLSERLASYGD